MHSLHLVDVVVLRMLRTRILGLLEILIGRLLVVEVLLLLRVMVWHAVCDWRGLTILLIVENGLTNLHVWDRLSVDNRR